MFIWEWSTRGYKKQTVAACTSVVVVYIMSITVNFWNPSTFLNFLNFFSWLYLNQLLNALLVNFSVNSLTGHYVRYMCAARHCKKYTVCVKHCVVTLSLTSITFQAVYLLPPLGVLEHILYLLVWTHQVLYKPHERIWQQGVIFPPLKNQNAASPVP